MTPQAVRDMLAEKLGADIEWIEAPPGDPFAMVPVEHWHAACKLARDDEALFFDFLRAQTGTDYPDDGQIEVVCHLFSYKHRHAIVLKTRVDRKDPKLATVCDVWPAADWYEREIFDLLGVHFDGHPDLRRLVLPEDWVGHPLRKDYKEEATYQGVSINATLNFTMSQSLIVAEAVERGLTRRLAVVQDISRMSPACTILVSCLDDWMHILANRDDIIAHHGALHWAGVAAMKKAYEIFQACDTESGC